jgi:hypothetical protein
LHSNRVSDYKKERKKNLFKISTKKDKISTKKDNTKKNREEMSQAKEAKQTESQAKEAKQMKVQKISEQMMKLCSDHAFSCDPRLYLQLRIQRAKLLFECDPQKYAYRILDDLFQTDQSKKTMQMLAETCETAGWWTMARSTWSQQLNNAKRAEQCDAKLKGLMDKYAGMQMIFTINQQHRNLVLGDKLEERMPDITMMQTRFQPFFDWQQLGTKRAEEKQASRFEANEEKQAAERKVAIQPSNVHGQGVFAKENMDTGSMVLVEPCLGATTSGKHCAFCLSVLPKNKAVHCHLCGSATGDSYCSSTCLQKGQGWHRCSLKLAQIQSMSKEALGDMTIWVLLIKIINYMHNAKCFSLEDALLNIQPWQTIIMEKEQAEHGLPEALPSCIQRHQKMADLIGISGDPRFDMQAVLMLLHLLRRHSFGQNPYLVVPMQSTSHFFNHNATPNVGYRITTNKEQLPTIQWHTLRNIASGEELFFSYVPTSMTGQVRVNQLALFNIKE